MAPTDRTEEGRICSAVDIVGMVAEYLPLRREGSHFVGLCPFHDDRRGSLRVDPAGRRFACRSCGRSGSVVDFVTTYEAVDRAEAMRMLADRASAPPRVVCMEIGGPAPPGWPPPHYQTADCHGCGRAVWASESDRYLIASRKAEPVCFDCAGYTGDPP